MEFRQKEKDEDEEVEKIIKQASRDSEEVTLRAGNISLILSDYEDIFSDFDPRPYSERSLSDDFLFECKKATTDKQGDFELRLMIPRAKRNLNYEVKIKRRLKDHFQKHVEEKSKEVRRTVRNGLILAAIGFILLTLSALIVFNKFLEGTFAFAVLLILLEPAGWFFFWEGLAKAFLIYEESEKKKRDLQFYKRIAKAKVLFLEY